uniref:L-serine ammonia-lyase n=1 Tax=Rhabditophanes sp. KR3021 TaxID=114890 RepID=A0AC35UCZ7_9BILA
MEFNDILKAVERVEGYVTKTELRECSSINKMVNKEIYFKCENFQQTGSFKARGALNSIKKHLGSGFVKGVTTHSSGNHGFALAWAASLHNLPCIVVVPSNTPQYKKDIIVSHGAQIIEVENTLEARKNKCNEIAELKEFLIVDPHNDYDVMAGQGTLGYEILQQNPETEAILVATGGGGVSSGISKFVKHNNKNVKVFMVEPEGKELQKSIDAKARIVTENVPLVNTIADGIRVPIADKCFIEVLKNCESTVLTVNNMEIKNAMKIIFEHMKMIVEPTGAVCMAALFKYKDSFLKDIKNITILICGGNVAIESTDLTNTSN